MIISDDHRLAFIHIPKCAGSSVRQQLAHLDSYCGAFSVPREHPSLGCIHYAHLPLSDLESYFPEQYEKVCRYESFALVREPHARFVSAVLQHLHEFLGDGTEKLSRNYVACQTSAVIESLRSGDVGHSTQFVHFVRQDRYVRLRGKPIVRNVFRLDDFHLFIEAMRSKCNVTIQGQERINERQVADNMTVSTLKKIGGPAYRYLVSPKRRERIRRAMWSARLNYSARQLYDEVMEDRAISSFVEDYYEDDMSLYHSL